MSVITSLTPGEILACMFSNNIGTFHWGIFLVIDGKNAYKLHAKQYRTIFDWGFEDPPPIHDLLKSSSLAAMVKIGAYGHLLPQNHTLTIVLSNSGTIPLHNFDNAKNHIVSLVREIPMTVPAHEQEVIKTNVFHCRVWFREAIRKLHDNHCIYCPNVWNLYQECMGYARSNDRKFSSQPAKYFVSRESFSNANDAPQGYESHTPVATGNQLYRGNSGNHSYGGSSGYYWGYGTSGGSGGTSSGSYGSSRAYGGS
ncbi:hypothetical protein EV360DRAFT_48619 [Lentinula raphanica]|nr:hypothetical protein EV360DRAFT_48619 [Lentinula raphanica]